MSTASLDKYMVHIAVSVAVLGLGWMWIRSGDSASVESRIAAEGKKLAALSPVGGEPITQAQPRRENQAALQRSAVTKAETALLMELPPAYTTGDVNQAGNQVRADFERLRQRALSRRITLPPMPLQGASLASEEGPRQRQLAELYVLVRTVELILDSGVSKITQLGPTGGSLSPDGNYGVLTMGLTVEAPQVVMLDVLRKFREEHQRGLGLREVVLTPSKDTTTLMSTVSVLLTLEQCAGFGLKPEAALTGIGEASPAAASLDPALATPPGQSPPAPSGSSRFGNKAP